jgi:hypothetical protein
MGNIFSKKVVHKILQEALRHAKDYVSKLIEDASFQD